MPESDARSVGVGGREVGEGGGGIRGSSGFWSEALRRVWCVLKIRKC